MRSINCMQFFMGTDWVSFFFFFFFFIPLYIISKGLLLSESLPSNLLETGVGRKEKGANYWGGNLDQHFASLASLIPKHTTSRYTTVQMYWCKTIWKKHCTSPKNLKQIRWGDIGKLPICLPFLLWNTTLITYLCYLLEISHSLPRITCFHSRIP